MPHHTALYSVLKLFPIAGFAVLMYRLYSTGLYKRYTYFWLYVLVELIKQIAGAVLSIRSNAYALFYLGSEIVVWTLCVLAVLEVYDHVLLDHPGVTQVR